MTGMDALCHAVEAYTTVSYTHLLLFSYASLVKKKIPKADSMYPGTGAAGGLGFAFLTFMAVSYTHLDVYKRQERERERRKILCLRHGRTGGCL